MQLINGLKELGLKIAGLKNSETEHKRSEEELHNERQKFQILTENAPFGMVIVI